MTRSHDGVAPGKRAWRAPDSRSRKLLEAPKDDPWIWITASMLGHPAYQALSITARKILEFLYVEHISHARQENGNLLAPYDHLEGPPFNISRRLISRGLAELYAAGFVVKTSLGGLFDGVKHPATYRLTMYADYEGRLPATHGWRRAAADAARRGRQEIDERAAGRRARSSAERTVVRFRPKTKPGART